MCVQQHHAELAGGIRQAQAGVRHSKGGDLVATVEWCERGIAMYGDDAFSLDWVVGQRTPRLFPVGWGLVALTGLRSRPSESRYSIRAALHKPALDPSFVRK